MLDRKNVPNEGFSSYSIKQIFWSSIKELSMKNKKEELYLAYFDASEEMKQIKEEQKILIGICSLLFIFVMI